MNEYRKLMETLDTIERGIREDDGVDIRQGSTVMLNDIKGLAKWYAQGDRDEYNFWVTKFQDDNTFYVMEPDISDGMMLVDYNGDEIEAPKSFFTITTSSNSGVKDDARGMMRGMHD